MTVKTPKVTTAGRIVGIALLVGGVVGVLLAIVGIIVGPMVVTQVGTTAKNLLTLTVDGLNSAKVTLEQAKTGIEQVQTGLDAVETTIVDAGTMVSDSDETLTNILTTVSQDVPDAIDDFQAAVPPAAESAKSFLVDVENAMAGAGDFVEQNGPLVNGAVKAVSRDVPDSLDYWSTAFTSTATAAHDFLATLEPAIVNTGQTLKQADAAWRQGVTFVSQGVPDTIDYWNAAIPPTADLAKSYLGSVETSLDNASTMAGQYDAMLDQAVQVASQDVPDAIDFWRTAIPPNAALLKAYVDSAEANLAQASAVAAQYDATLDQAVKVASQDVPDTIDAWNAVIPPNAELAKAYVNLVEANLAQASAMAGEADATLNQAVQVVSQDVPDALDAWNAVIPPNAELAKAYVSSAEASLANASATAGQYDAMLDQTVKVVSQDVPDTIDAWNAVIPPNAELAKAYVNTVEANLAQASAMAGQADATLDQAVQLVSQDMPEALDAWTAVIPPNAELAKAYVSSAEASLANASALAGQADAMLDQAVKVASQDVPDTIDAWTGVIPPNAELAKAYVSSAEASLANAGALAGQADAALGQAVKVASQDVPDTIDAWNAVIPPNTELAKAYVSSAETSLANASALVDQANTSLDQAVKVASQDVPDTIEAWTGVVPPNAEAAQTALGNVQNTLDWAKLGVDGTRASLDATTQVVPATLDQVDAYIPSVTQATEANINSVLALLQQLQYLDGSYRVELSADQLSASLAYLTALVGAMDDAAGSNLDVVDQNLAALSGNTQTLQQQIEQFVAVAGQLEQMSEQLRSLEATYDESLDLGAASQYLMLLSQNAAAINAQIDQLAGVSGQLAQVSEQLRGLEPLYYSNIDLDALSQYLMLMSQNAAAINAQIDQFVAMSSQVEAISAQLRGLETAYSDSTLDLGAVSQDLLAASQSAAAVNDQIDQLAALSGQQLGLMSEQLRNVETAYKSVLDVGALSEQLAALAQSAAAVNPQIDQLAALSSQQLDLTSQQLRSLETAYEQSIDLGALSEQLAALSQAAAAVNPQIDQLAALSGQQLDLTSQQLRSVGTAYEDSALNLGLLSQQLSAMAQSAAAANDQIDLLVALASQQLDLTSEQLRSLEAVYNANVDLGALSQQLDAMSQSAAALNPQIDQLAALSDQQLALVSQQLRALEPLYNQNVNLGATSEFLAGLAQNVAAVNAQVDQVAAVTDQLETVSQQLRALEAYSNIGLGDAGDTILALSEQYIDVADQQVDPWIAAATQAAGQMSQWSSALRALEPYSNIDYGAVRGQILDLSGNLPAVRDQIDQLVAMSSQLEQVSGALRSLAPLAETDFQAIGQDISNVSTTVSAVSTQLDGFAQTADQLTVQVDSTIASIEQTQATLDGRLNLIKLVIIIFMVWIVLVMLAPLYLGWVLISGRFHFLVVEA